MVRGGAAQTCLACAAVADCERTPESSASPSLRRSSAHSAWAVAAWRSSDNTPLGNRRRCSSSVTNASAGRPAWSLEVARVSNATSCLSVSGARTTVAGVAAALPGVGGEVRGADASTDTIGAGLEMSTFIGWRGALTNVGGRGAKSSAPASPAPTTEPASACQRSRGAAETGSSNANSGPSRASSAL